MPDIQVEITAYSDDDSEVDLRAVLARIVARYREDPDSLGFEDLGGNSALVYV